MKQQRNNIDEIDKLLYEYFDSNTNIPDSTAEIIKNTPLKKKSRYNKIFNMVATVITISILTTGIVFAKDIVNFFENIFNLNAINLKNDGAVDAIINKDYVQQIEMNYIKINNDYKIKVDYLMIDDINLYAIFNLHSNKKIHENIRFSILDLIISDSNGNILYDGGDPIMSDTYFSVPGWKKVDSSNKAMQEFFFLLTTGLPNSSSLEFKFTKLLLYDCENSGLADIEVTCDCKFDLNIDKKFQSREKIEYKIESNIDTEYVIENCIATETGLYIILKTPNTNISFELLDTNVSGGTTFLGTDSNNYCHMLTQFNITKSELSKYESIQLKDLANNIITLKKV